MANYLNKNILITGGTGFIGSRLTERLVLEEKANVTVLVNSWTKATWVSRLDVKLVQGSVLDESLLDELCKDVDLIFHCVGIGGSMEECMRINVQGTQKILESAVKNKVTRIVYFSSVVVSGPVIYENMNENVSFKKTGNPYADSKIEAEKLFLNFIENQEIEGSVIRPTFVWGPISPYYTIDVIQQMKSNTFHVIDEGKGANNAVYVDNLVDLTLICGIHPKANQEVFLIRDLEKVSWRNFYSFYSEMLKLDFSNFKSIPSRSNFIRKLNLKFKKTLEKIKLSLSLKINKWNAKNPLMVKLFLKAPRKILKKLIKKIENKFPEADPWDLETYSSKGFIDISKSEKILGYIPRVSIKEGMEECRKSLIFQNIIE